MSRRTVERGVAALAFVAVLTLAGAQPAAAAKTPTSARRMVSLWSVLTSAGQHAVLGAWEGVQSLFDGAPAPQPQSKKGWGIDPNGNSLRVIEDGGTVSDPDGVN